jgi:polyisoprenoid-binding protein YceI
MTPTSALTTARPTDLATGTWDIDQSHSDVGFVARHLFSRVRGRFSQFSGVIDVTDDPADASVEVTIEAASIDTNHSERDEHLRGEGFLDVEKFPALTFRSTAVTAFGEDGQGRIEGLLTIREITHPVVLDVEYLGAATDPWGGVRAGFSAHTEIDRDDFGANWNVVLETGGILIGKTVEIELEIEAVRRSP